MSYELQPRAAGQTWSPGPGVVLAAAAATDTGPVRQLNEDRYLVSPPVFLVADGMGGHGAGDLASALVSDVFAELAGTLIDAGAVRRAVERAAVRVGELARTRDDRAPGSTIAAVCYVEEAGTPYWCVASMGDSRVYLSSASGITQVTRDHSVVQDLIDRGTISELEAASHPERHVITRALGADLRTPADFSLVPVQAGTRVLICSDGVTGTLTDGELAEVLGTGAPSEAAERLLAVAFSAGGRDNATAVVVDVASFDRSADHHELDDTVETAVAGTRGEFG